MRASEIQSQYQTALRHQSEGRFQKALDIYRGIIQEKPNAAEVHYQAGQIFLGALQFSKAVNHLRAATEIKPNEPAIWIPYTKALVALADRKQTNSALQTLRSSSLSVEIRNSVEVVLRGSRPNTRMSAGNADRRKIQTLLDLIRKGHFREAEELGMQLQSSWPNVALIANALGVAQRAQGRFAEAKTSFGRALAIESQFGEAHNNLGRLLLDLGDIRAATDHLLAALVQIPRSPGVLTNIGILIHRVRKSTDAESFFRRALKADATYAEAGFELGQELMRQSRYPEARKILKNTLRHTRKSTEMLIALAKAEESCGDGTTALKYYDQAIELAPDHAPAYSGKAVTYQHEGDFASAETLLRKAIELRPSRGEYYRLLSASHRFQDGDPLIDQMQSVFNQEGPSPSDRMELGFALSKAMEDCGNTERVFEYLDAANSLTRQLNPYDTDERISEINAVKTFFRDINPDDFRAVTGRTEFAPIFVTGLPRSGTTLVEQILSSHSTVEGAGEVGHFNREAAKLTIHSDSHTSIRDIGENDIRQLGKSYLEQVRERFPKAVRITDKSILTYMFIGLIRMALPEARIVLVRRNPRDNLYSIYKNRFPEGTHLYSYDFDDLAGHYQMFVDIVDYWQERIPDGFHEISYEKLIASPEPEIRALLKACNLDWEDGCLEFHRNRRAVTTLSVYQVRQPIFSSSVNAWKKYQSELQPLFDRIGLD